MPGEAQILAGKLRWYWKNWNKATLAEAIFEEVELENAHGGTRNLVGFIHELVAERQVRAPKISLHRRRKRFTTTATQRLAHLSSLSGKEKKTSTEMYHK